MTDDCTRARLSMEPAGLGGSRRCSWHVLFALSPLFAFFALAANEPPATMPTSRNVKGEICLQVPQRGGSTLDAGLHEGW